MDMDPFSIDLIAQAASRLAGKVVRTPLLASPMLDDHVGGCVFVKAENLQLTGSFKIRGALNKVLSMSDESRRAGIVAFSAGNHGQGVAAAARFVGCPAIIVMPTTAPQIKVDNCRWWGAEVVQYDPRTQDREEVARCIAGPRGMTVISPFDDHAVMAGQGSCGLEIVQQLQELAVVPDVLVICCSGGGLASGVTEALRHTFPRVQVYVAEILGFEKMARSLQLGHAQRNASVPTTLLDGINGPTAGTLPLQVLLRHGVQGIGISDDEAIQGVRAAFRWLKLVLEPGGAAALGGVLTSKIDTRGKNIVVVASGGNVDPSVFARVLEVA